MGCHITKGVTERCTARLRLTVNLTEALDIFQQENSLNYDDIAPSTQHEELEHIEFPTTISTTFEYYDPE